VVKRFRLFLKGRVLGEEENMQRQGQRHDNRRVPFGDDNKKGKGKSKTMARAGWPSSGGYNERRNSSRRLAATVARYLAVLRMSSMGLHSLARAARAEAMVCGLMGLPVRDCSVA
jgi:hypothetical protein